jgi:glycosyltransferase involved in cell wall biosynthesis
MNILIANDGPSAFLYIRLGIARAFSVAGHNVNLWHIDQKPVHDAFDEYNPDLFLGQTYNTTRTVVQAIKERPNMRVIMKAGDWGPLTEHIPSDKFGVLKASEQERQTILDLYKETGKPDYVHIYYHPRFVEQTHGYWSDNGIPVHHHMLAADIFDYTNGRKMQEFESDITFIGGYWPYKGQNIDKYLLPFCFEQKYNIKIFGNANWPVVQYCGFAPQDLTKHILASATVCPQLHEPHSNVFGFDMSERSFKLLSNRCFVVSDYVAGLDYLFGEDECLVLTKSPEEFRERIEYFIQNPDDRQGYIERGYKAVMDDHTYFHRARDMFQNLGLDQEANELIHVYYNLRKNVDENNSIQFVG